MLTYRYWTKRKSWDFSREKLCSKCVFVGLSIKTSTRNLSSFWALLGLFSHFWISQSDLGITTPKLRLLIPSFRPLELSFIFLLVWYYCTLTIRESILKVNGSRIKGWWRLHHFLSTVAAGILLIWPDTETWAQFRTQFMWFNAYISNFRNCFCFK